MPRRRSTVDASDVLALASSLCASLWTTLLLDLSAYVTVTPVDLCPSVSCLYSLSRYFVPVTREYTFNTVASHCETRLSCPFHLTYIHCSFDAPLSPLATVVVASNYSLRRPHTQCIHWSMSVDGRGYFYNKERLIERLSALFAPCT